MEVLTVVEIVVSLSYFPVATGFTAKDLNRKFWPWFLIGILLPFVAIVILFCLPIKQRKKIKYKTRRIVYKRPEESFV